MLKPHLEDKFTKLANGEVVLDPDILTQIKGDLLWFLQNFYILSLSKRKQLMSLLFIVFSAIIWLQVDKLGISDTFFTFRYTGSEDKPYRLTISRGSANRAEVLTTVDFNEATYHHIVSNHNFSAWLGNLYKNESLFLANLQNSAILHLDLPFRYIPEVDAYRGYRSITIGHNNQLIVSRHVQLSDETMTSTGIRSYDIELLVYNLPETTPRHYIVNLQDLDIAENILLSTGTNHRIIILSENQFILHIPTTNPEVSIIRMLTIDPQTGEIANNEANLPNGQLIQTSDDGNYLSIINISPVYINPFTFERLDEPNDLGNFGTHEASIHILNTQGEILFSVETPENYEIKLLERETFWTTYRGQQGILFNGQYFDPATPRTDNPDFALPPFQRSPFTNQILFLPIEEGIDNPEFIPIGDPGQELTDVFPIFTQTSESN